MKAGCQDRARPVLLCCSPLHHDVVGALLLHYNTQQDGVLRLFMIKSRVNYRADLTEIVQNSG